MSDLVSEFGISNRALRFYESRGLLSPDRIAGWRVYSPEQRARLIEILRGKALGLTLAEIAEALQAGGGRVQLSLQEIDHQIAHLERQKKDIETAIQALIAQRPHAKSADEGRPPDQFGSEHSLALRTLDLADCRRSERADK